MLILFPIVLLPASGVGIPPGHSWEVEAIFPNFWTCFVNLINKSTVSFPKRAGSEAFGDPILISIESI